MINKVRKSLASIARFAPMPWEAKVEHLKDSFFYTNSALGIRASIHESVNWLCMAQDKSVTRDGGIARHYSLISGWGPSYPETSGYIVSTMIQCAELMREKNIRERARKILQWLARIQLPGGAFQAGTVSSKPVVPCVFNTGQILLGLSAGVQEFGSEYIGPLRLAADWLVAVQDDDGCWRKYASPFVIGGEKSYDTHVAWGLFEAGKVTGKSRYFEAGVSNVRWALNFQEPNGWFMNCCLSDFANPLTHTIGYALRGVIEAYECSKEAQFLRAACKTGDALIRTIKKSGFIPGRLNNKWKGTVSWACLTGCAQVACCWLRLFQLTGNQDYFNAAAITNQYVRSNICLGRGDKRGGVKGSFPVYGDYGPYEYLNWAAKFAIDANVMELEARNEVYDLVPFKE
jgi:hypothetical protein